MTSFLISLTAIIFASTFKSSSAKFKYLNNKMTFLFYNFLHELNINTYFYNTACLTSSYTYNFLMSDVMHNKKFVQ